MVFLGTDFGVKYVIADIDGEEFTISFRESFWKGIYDVSIRGGKSTPTFKIKSTYPGFPQRILEAVLLTRLSLKQAINRKSKRGC